MKPIVLIKTHYTKTTTGYDCEYTASWKIEPEQPAYEVWKSMPIGSVEWVSETLKIECHK